LERVPDDRPTPDGPNLRVDGYGSARYRRDPDADDAYGGSSAGDVRALCLPSGRYRFAISDFAARRRSATPYLNWTESSSPADGATSRQVDSSEAAAALEERDEVIQNFVAGDYEEGATMISWQ